MSLGEGLDLNHELRLTKAALLYADQVSLAGPKVQALAYVDRFRTASAPEQDAMVRRMVHVMPGGAEALSQLDGFVRARGGLTAVRARQARDKLFSQTRDELTQKIGELLSQAAFEQFLEALDSGNLVLEPLLGNAKPRASEAADFLVGALSAAAAAQGAATTNAEPKEALNRGVMERVVDLIIRLLEPGSGSQPLFDATIGDMAHSLVKLARVGGADADVDFGREPALATQLMGTVPAYVDAPMSEILDARRALREPLIRFRAAVSSFAETVAAIPPGPDFEQEVALLYRKTVAPELLQLEEIQRELRLDRELVRHTLAAGKDAVAGVVAVAAVRAMDLDAIAQAVAAVAPAGAKIASSILEERRELGQRRRENRVLFLYELAHRFPRSS